MTQQLDFINALAAPPKPLFHGADYLAERDKERLTTQIQRLFYVCRDGRWRTVPALARELEAEFPGAHFPENSISAQLRNLRKVGCTVERRHVSNGLFEYRVIEVTA